MVRKQDADTLFTKKVYRPIMIPKEYLPWAKTSSVALDIPKSLFKYIKPNASFSSKMKLCLKLENDVYFAFSSRGHDEMFGDFCVLRPLLIFDHKQLFVYRHVDQRTPCFSTCVIAARPGLEIFLSDIVKKFTIQIRFPEIVYNRVRVTHKNIFKRLAKPLVANITDIKADNFSIDLLWLNPQSFLKHSNDCPNCFSSCFDNSPDRCLSNYRDFLFKVHESFGTVLDLNCNQSLTNVANSLGSMLEK